MDKELVGYKAYWFVWMIQPFIQFLPITQFLYRSCIIFRLILCIFSCGGVQPWKVTDLLQSHLFLFKNAIYCVWKFYCILYYVFRCGQINLNHLKLESTYLCMVIKKNIYTDSFGKFFFKFFLTLSPCGKILQNTCINFDKVQMFETYPLFPPFDCLLWLPWELFWLPPPPHLSQHSPPSHLPPPPPPPSMSLSAPPLFVRPRAPW